MKFKVFVDDNFHYQDESERYQHGEFDTWEEAVVACKAIVDRNLEDMFSADKSAGELYSHYTSFGDDPFVLPAAPGRSFSAWDYAKQRCEELCGGGSSAPALQPKPAGVNE